ncbi:Protease synthase and sporulation protein PAI 2 [Shimia sp. SK013]|uniref:FMN-binding negative transcriptional regulator n=1 Tax=Shimia sp. SK013 TaxID=1389006 RepID=UPI0006B4E93E|nr:FMN-binding negative transcriptional regulator [Shimia sp. SK013]KPA20411.1 Protease synthase and sporulation protein PAI 2 [Shimia sp. SK013]
MHPNPTFRDADAAQNLAFARDRGFGVLTLSTDGAPLLSHVPFLVSGDGSCVDLHLVRSNPMARALRDPKTACLAVSGPDSYVSPDWYDMDDQVPTWNYVAVHLTGTLAPLPQSDLPDLLDRLSDHFEAQLLPKPPWSSDKMDSEAYTRMLRMIQPFRLQIADVQGTWKLGQNKPTEARHAAARQMAAQSVGSHTRELAAMMQSPVSDPKKD